MTEAIPKWLMKRYSKLWKKFKEKEFSFEEALETLKEKDERVLSVILSDLKKAGWVVLALSPTDARKRIYKLKEPNIIVEALLWLIG